MTDIYYNTVEPFYTDGWVKSMYDVVSSIFPMCGVNRMWDSIL